MKIITVLILFFSTAAFAQTDSIPRNGNNRVIVKNVLNKKENFIKVKTLLAENGIGIDKQDNEVYQLQSSPKNIKGTANPAVFYFLCKDNEVVINGTIDLTVTVAAVGVKDNLKSLPILYDKKQKTLAYKAFNEMVDFGKVLGSVTYLTK